MTKKTPRNHQHSALTCVVLFLVLSKQDRPETDPLGLT